MVTLVILYIYIYIYIQIHSAEGEHIQLNENDNTTITLQPGTYHIFGSALVSWYRPMLKLRDDYADIMGVSYIRLVRLVCRYVNMYGICLSICCMHGTYGGCVYNVIM